MAETDLTGQWDGEFAYPADKGPATPFLATIEQSTGHLSGTVIEPDLHSGAAPAEAVIEGVVAGNLVDFTKTYTRVSHGYANPVDYVGQVVDDGDRITGVWSIYEMNGTFEMTRHQARKAAEVRKTKAEISQ